MNLNDSFPKDTARISARLLLGIGIPCAILGLFWAAQPWWAAPTEGGLPPSQRRTPEHSVVLNDAEELGGSRSPGAKNLNLEPTPDDIDSTGLTNDASNRSTLDPLASNVSKSLVIGGYPDSYPYIEMDEGNPDGICIRIVREAFSRIDTEVTFKILPFKRLLQEARAGRMGVMGFYYNSERAKEFDYTDTICTMNLSAFGKDEVLQRFKSLEDLRGLSVAVARGPSYGPEIDAALASDDVNVVLVNGFDAVMRMLANDRVDLAFDNPTRGKRTLSNLGDSKSIGRSDWVVGSNNTYVAFPKSMHAQEAIIRFNKALATMHADGTYRAIISEFTSQESLEDFISTGPTSNAEEKGSPVSE